MFCNKCGNQMEDSATFCGVCGNRIGGNPQTATAQPPAKSKKPLIALISIPLVVLIAGVGIFALRGTEKSTATAPSTASSAGASIAAASRSAAEVNAEPEEPGIAPWKQLYFDGVQEGICDYLHSLGNDSIHAPYNGLSSARLYDLDEDGVPELLLHFSALDQSSGSIYAVKDGALVPDNHAPDGEASPYQYFDTIKRNPQTGVYLAETYHYTGVNYFLYENGQWRFVFGISRIYVDTPDTEEGRALQERFAVDQHGTCDYVAIDEYLAPYSEEVSCVKTNFEKPGSWLSSSQELIDLFNAYDGDDRFDVPLEDRLEKPWGETYAEIMARLYNQMDDEIQAWWQAGGHDGFAMNTMDGLQIVDMDMDGIPELYVRIYSSMWSSEIGTRVYYADGSWTQGIGIGINRVYRHKTDGRLMHSRWDYDQWGEHITGLSCYFSDTSEPFMGYRESSVIDDYGTPYYASDNPLEEQAACDANATAALQDSLADYEDLNAAVYSFRILYDFSVDPPVIYSGTLQEAQAWVKSLPGAMA